MANLTKQLEAAMKVLSDLAAAAKAVGDGDLMCAAGRAMTELHNYQTVSLKDAIVERSRREAK